MCPKALTFGIGVHCFFDIWIPLLGELLTTIGHLYGDTKGKGKHRPYGPLHYLGLAIAFSPWRK